MRGERSLFSSSRWHRQPQAEHRGVSAGKIRAEPQHEAVGAGACRGESRGAQGGTSDLVRGVFWKPREARV